MCLKKKMEAIPARTVLYYLSLSGFIVSYMLRTDMNVAIVAMVREDHKLVNNDTEKYSVCFGNNDLDTFGNGTKADSSLAYKGNLTWTINEQSYVLASFYWMYVISQVLGAVLTQKWGMKKVYGFACVITAACSFFLPLASGEHFGFAILIRSIQGFVLGVTWPAMFAGQTYWIPSNERSSFLTSFQGYNLGIGITYPICGMIITYFGWEAVFYTTGTLGMLWSLIWYFLAYDSPELHPRISATEKQYLRDNVETVSYEDSKRQKIPWLRIVSSGPVIVIGMASFGWIWVNYVFIIAGPTYLKSILGFNIGHSGILSGLPFLVSFPMGFLFHYIAEKIIKAKLMKTISVRKLFTGLAAVLPGVMCCAIGYLDCNSNAILACILIAISFPSAMFAGCVPNIVAIAPEFGGAAIAVIQTMYMMASFLSPLTTGYLTQDGHNLQAWKNVFNVATGVAIATFIPYLIWATDKVQPWNYSYDSSMEVEQKEKMLQKVNGKNIQIVKNGNDKNNVIRKSVETIC